MSSLVIPPSPVVVHIANQVKREEPSCVDFISAVMVKAHLDPKDRQARRKIEAMVFSSRLFESGGDENTSYAANSVRSGGNKVTPIARADSLSSELDFDKCSISTILDSMTINSNLVSTLEPSAISFAAAPGGASPIQVVQDLEELQSLKHQYLVDREDPTAGCCNNRCTIS